MSTQARPWPVLVMLTLSMVAIAVGWFVNHLKVEWFVAGFLGALAVGWVFLNYRVGVVCLTVLLPWSWSPLLPQTQGFNIVTFLLLATIASLGIRRGAGREPMVWPPAEVIWCYLVPLAVAVGVAWPNLPVGEANFPPWITGQEQLFTPSAFLKDKVIKPAFFVVYAFAIANAVRDSAKPERFIVVLAVAAMLPALAIIDQLVFVGGDVNDRKNFLANLGLQVNEYGALLAIAAGPFLFIAGSVESSRAVRVMAGTVFCTVTTALLMTASRGAVVGLMVTVFIWLLRRRRVSDLLICLAAVGLLIVVVPDSVQERLTMGLDNIGATSTTTIDDPLTKGRVQTWAALGPEFFKSDLGRRTLVHCVEFGGDERSRPDDASAQPVPRDPAGPRSRGRGPDRLLVRALCAHDAPAFGGHLAFADAARVFRWRVCRLPRHAGLGYFRRALRTAPGPDLPVVFARFVFRFLEAGAASGDRRSAQAFRAGRQGAAGAGAVQVSAMACCRPRKSDVWRARLWPLLPWHPHCHVCAPTLHALMKRPLHRRTRLRNEPGRVASVKLERRLLLGASVAWCLFGNARVLQLPSAPSAAIIRDGWVLSESD